MRRSVTTTDTVHARSQGEIRIAALQRVSGINLSPPPVPERELLRAALEADDVLKRALDARLPAAEQKVRRDTLGTKLAAVEAALNTESSWPRTLLTSIGAFRTAFSAVRSNLGSATAAQLRPLSSAIEALLEAAAPALPSETPPADAKKLITDWLTSGAINYRSSTPTVAVTAFKAYAFPFSTDRFYIPIALGGAAAVTPDTTLKSIVAGLLDEFAGLASLTSNHDFHLPIPMIYPKDPVLGISLGVRASGRLLDSKPTDAKALLGRDGFVTASGTARWVIPLMGQKKYDPNNRIGVTTLGATFSGLQASTTDYLGVDVRAPKRFWYANFFGSIFVHDVVALQFGRTFRTSTRLLAPPETWLIGLGLDREGVNAGR